MRELGTGHREATAALWQHAGWTRPWNDPRADCARAVDGPASAVLGGFDGDDLVAAAMVGHDGHRGVPKLNLMVRATNAAANGFYDARGDDDVRVRSKRL